MDSSETEKKDYLRLFLKGFLLNFANPLVIFYWFSVITLADQSVGAESGEFKMFIFLGVVLLTFFLFDLLKILGAKQLKPLMTPYIFKQMNRLIGIVFFFFGLFLILQNLDLKGLLNQIRI
jgi:threonine/homoserine/homoserine lactone efflux protein